MKNTGQNSGTNDADIDAPEAWELCTGGITSSGDTVVVAVVDGGFFIAHQDINFWKNYAEIPGNSIDDDGNGYVDDVNGWNAYNNNGTITSSQHGTHVSGTVAAKGNNNLGVVGMNWNAKVMAIQASSGTESVVVAGYAYAFKLRQMYNQSNGAAGAFVVSTNSSFGVDNGNPNSYPIWCGMYDSLGAVGVLSAGATANANFNIDVTGDMPTACPNNHLITVTNTDRNDVKASSAGYGLTTIDLGAPGSTIYSTTPNNAYASLSGTSMATTHVAGAVALMISAACPLLLEDYKNYPDSIALVFKQFMLNHVDAITNLQNQTLSGGRLNVYNSLVAINEYCMLTADKTMAIAQSMISNLELQPNPAQSALQLFYNLSASGDVTIKVIDMAGRAVKQISRANFSEGFHSHIIDVQDLEAGIYFIQLQTSNSKSEIKKFIKN
jgi:subtilisin family serine protease